MKLSKYQKRVGIAQQRKHVVILWNIFGEPLIKSFIPGSKLRIFLLRLFGAKIGEGVVIKPRVQIKYPWKLKIGDNSWVGENVWIDNLVDVTIDHDVCVSQGVYLCTGSHNWSSITFDLITQPIVIEAHTWICAKAVIGPGSVLGQGSVVGMGCVFSGTLEPWHIVSVPPDRKYFLKKREFLQSCI
ncbi:WcaF family extracellular polysaccharide biosynthesis acetyltransferase [Roseobacter sp. HKCC-CH-9208]|uniref:WcaF family extracellular polysaccharide biosynthesis acetyltransferase n=1 Tax=Roseobacter sp. HKCC-CH-9208 TaxID=3120339 RepID=UPI0030EF799A